jgi:5-bromo-4-chloroindolyl phosphate hydrolysis protein
MSNYLHARKTIQIGEDLIKEIHEKKVAISDYDMTIKLSNLETILKKIFKRVEKHPEVVPQMRKMMDYYLPTTIKLLDAYVQLDKQAVDGVNILSAKAEIEESLDTLITAYEKLLDDLFEDIMLDVSTDISVLNTMLAQDGLANDELGDIRETLEKEVSTDE